MAKGKQKSQYKSQYKRAQPRSRRTHLYPEKWESHLHQLHINQYCNTAFRICSTNFPAGIEYISENEGKCFVPLRDFRQLQKKYYQLFERYKKIKQKADEQ